MICGAADGGDRGIVARADQGQDVLDDARHRDRPAGQEVPGRAVDGVDPGRAARRAGQRAGEADVARAARAPRTPRWWRPRHRRPFSPGRPRLPIAGSLIDSAICVLAGTPRVVEEHRVSRPVACRRGGRRTGARRGSAPRCPAACRCPRDGRPPGWRENRTWGAAAWPGSPGRVRSWPGPRTPGSRPPGLRWRARRRRGCLPW